MAGSSSGEDTVVQVGPGGSSQPDVTTLALLGCRKEACTSSASFSWSSTCGTFINSLHQLGIL